jgi:hypothetical protein
LPLARHARSFKAEREATDASKEFAKRHSAAPGSSSLSSSGHVFGCSRASMCSK